MRIAPEDLTESDLIAALSHDWGLTVPDLEYVPLGFGSHHWRAVDSAGTRLWVTVDELDRKVYLGATPDAVLDNLRSAFDTARSLRDRGLEFVVAPVPSLGGETVRRLNERLALVVFPFVEASVDRFGKRPGLSERAELVDMLVRLHAAAAPAVRPASVQVLERGHLELALQDLDREWAGGPFAEPARALVATRANDVRRLLHTFDCLADRVASTGAKAVVTHGEPHSGNVLRAGGRLLLVDWDTVALAPPERDLWMLDTAGGAERARYAEASGRPVHDAAIRLYRLRWQLDDIATFLSWFRSAHRRTADTEHAWQSFVRSMGSSGIRDAGVTGDLAGFVL